ncbi:hypothetical protein JTE90_019192 [Oedothorax gibbosus]|uniref:RING-type domain-containing protein n=1 Tax=Oedothorax gibbosus TaxID=931172 RepID=A0AAV6U5L1_9ARAC|nr:hypothetical protein JTE90_019192 [Oedothorax gibbosus]
MDPGSNEINPTGNTQSQTAGTLALTPSNSETPPYSYNLRNLPSRVTSTVQNTMNSGYQTARRLAVYMRLSNFEAHRERNNQPDSNLEEQSRRNSQQQPNVEELTERNSQGQLNSAPGRNNLLQFDLEELPERSVQTQLNLRGSLERDNQMQSNFEELPERNSQGQLNLGGLLEIENQQQPDLQRQERAIEQQRNRHVDRRGPIQFKLPTEEIPEAELDDTKCAICLRSAREYKKNRKPVAKTHCGHFFCIPCIFRWKKSSQNCPSCRQAILKPRDARGLYLFHVV